MFNPHSIFRLLMFWFWPVFGMFAAGAAAIGGGEGAGAAVLDSGTGEVEGAGEGDGQGQGEGQGAGAGEGQGGEGDGKQGQGQGDGRRVADPIKKHLAELKTSNPDLYRKLNDQYWAHKNLTDKIAKEFPDGIDSAIALKQKLEDVGDLDEIQAEIAEWRDVDQMLEAGDPNVVKTIFEQFPDGVKTLMPTVMETFAEIDPQGYDHYFAGVLVNTLSSSEFTTNLRLAATLLQRFDLDKNPELKEAFNLLAGNLKYLNGMKELATKAPAAASAGNGNKGNDEVTRLRNEMAQKERKQILNDIGSSFVSFALPKFEATLKDLLKNKPLSDGGKEQVFTDARRNIFSILAGPDPENKPTEFLRKYNTLIGAGDKAGALRLLQSRAEPLLAEALTKAYKRLYGEATLGSNKGGNQNGNRNGNDKGNQGGGGQGGNGNQGAAGFELINYDPKPSSIDRGKTEAEAKKLGLTYFQMINRNQAVLKGGKKVTWKAGAPAEK